MDGFPPGTGVIGRVVATGVPVVLQHVDADPEFIAAIPGLSAEACTPVRVDGRVVGAVNVESTGRLPADVGEVLAAAAAALVARIQVVGGLPPVPQSQRLARIAVGLSALTDAADIYPRVVAAAMDVSGIDSVAVCRRGRDGQWSVAHAGGTLVGALTAWTGAEYRVVAGWVAAGNSSHFLGDPGDMPPGYEFLLKAGIRAVTVHPLVVGEDVTGLLVTADTAPTAHDPVIGAAVETLAAQASTCLGMATAIAELSRRAR